MSRRRNPNAGLFTGWWYDMAGKKIRRIRRDEYPLLYHLHRKQTAIRCGVTILGQKPNWVDSPPIQHFATEEGQRATITYSNVTRRGHGTHDA